ncbi:hypothetical protein BKA70DRAFT_1280028 [Coprinopsis sp. MPI-PUGE-AT-0042]|nr:hypothetical protein BKA70DRAFT_1280028 [Coprinopsis sp. MPI-PUGE-AT-0042]
MIKVEDTLFRVPKSILTKESPVFDGMFSVENQSEGGDDDHPIVLEGYESRDFGRLLKLLMPDPFTFSVPVLSKEEWISVLKLSTIWQMDKAKNLSIASLSGLALSPIEKIDLARKYRIPNWLREGVTSLAESFGDKTISEIADQIGWQTTALILFVRDSVQPEPPGTVSTGSVATLAGAMCWYCGGAIYTERNFYKCNAKCASATPPNPPPTNGPRGFANKSLDFSATILEVFGDELKELE